MLIRAAGPALAGFNLQGVLATPTINLVDFATGRSLASASGWDPSLAAAFTRVGAFAFTPGSADAALEVLLPAGGYTAEVTGQNGATGIALIEVYEDN